MAPTLLPRTPSITSSISSALSARSITPPSTIVSRAIHMANSALHSSTMFERSTSLIKRQSGGMVAIPSVYQGRNSGPSPGVVAGIVLGTVGGIVLVLWFIYSVISLSSGRRNVVIDEEIVHRRSVSRSPGRRHSRARSEVVEVRERSRPARERIIVEEHRTSAVVDEGDDDDIVEVIEEHSPPRRHRSSKRESGYRTVDPAEFGGGGRPLRKVRR